MLYVRVNRLDHRDKPPDFFSILEERIMIAVGKVMDINPARVFVSMPQEIARPGHWGQQPWVEVRFAEDDPEIRTLELLNAATKAACDVVACVGTGAKVVRGVHETFDEKIRYVKVPPDERN